MTDLMFWVAGVPQPQGSTRAFRRGSKIITTSDNQKLRPWRHAVTAEAQMRAHNNRFVGPVGLALEFYFARPKGHFGKRGLLPSAPADHIVKPDCSKLVRAVEDSLVDAGVLGDDNQVVLISARKHYADRQPPGAQIAIHALAQEAAALDEEGASPRPRPTRAAPD